MQKTSETKVLRDPVHGYIHVDLQVVWDCINAREMQRLRRIHQLGGVFRFIILQNIPVFHTLWGYMKSFEEWCMKLTALQNL